MDGWSILISAASTLLGFQIAYEAIARLFQAGFSSALAAGGMMLITAIVGWFIWQRQVTDFQKAVILGAGLLGILIGILKGIFG